MPVLLAVAVAAPSCDGGAPAAPLNQGFIGGQCSTSVAGDQCLYDHAVCLTDPVQGGMCSLACDQVCPDRQGAVTTFCVDGAELAATAGSGLCTTRCHFGRSPAGCRAGFQCVLARRFGDPDTEAYACVPGDDRAFELEACHRELLDAGVPFTPDVSPRESPSTHPQLACSVEQPVRIVEPILGGVRFAYGLDDTASAIFATCALARALDRLARLAAELSVVEVIHAGTYNCRVIAGSAQLSQHGLANAIDVSALRLADGTTYSVLEHWEKDTPVPSTPGGQLLRRFAERLHEDRTFNVILTPDYNASHADHLHLDLSPGQHVLE